jgi:hypothetical protein
VEQDSLDDARLEFAVLCDYYTVLQNGCYDLIGVGGNVFTAPFPRALAYLFVRVLVPYRELSSDLHHRLTIALNDDDGPTIADPSVSFTPTKNPNWPEGTAQVSDFIFDLRAIHFQREGIYTIKILWNDEEIGKITFRLREPEGL